MKRKVSQSNTNGKKLLALKLVSEGIANFKSKMEIVDEIVATCGITQGRAEASYEAVYDTVIRLDADYQQKLTERLLANFRTLARQIESGEQRAAAAGDDEGLRRMMHLRLKMVDTARRMLPQDLRISSGDGQDLKFLFDLTTKE